MIQRITATDMPGQRWYKYVLGAISGVIVITCGRVSVHRYGPGQSQAVPYWRSMSRYRAAQVLKGARIAYLTAI